MCKEKCLHLDHELTTLSVEMCKEKCLHLDHELTTLSIFIIRMVSGWEWLVPEPNVYSVVCCHDPCDFRAVIVDNIVC